jgi:outer membrane lipoprotein carrier protein
MQLRSIALAALLGTVALAALGVEVCAQPADPAPLSADQTASVISAVQAFYDRTTNYEADFTQEYLIKQYNKRESKHGHVVFDKPAKMNWTYDAPSGNRVVSDGHKVRVYEPANKQMFESDMSASQYPAALSFLTGQGKLTDAFDFTLVDGASMGFPGGQVLVGVPKTPTPAYQKVFLYVDTATKQVRRALIIDGQGNHNRFDFANARTVDEKERSSPRYQSQFSFTPPPGTTTVHP